MGAAALLSAAVIAPCRAQLCTTQSKLTPALRDTLAQTALALGTAVKSTDLQALRAATVTLLANNFASTEGLVRSTGAELTGDTLQVTQLYVLDATSRPADAGTADFSCPLDDAAASETDFSINGLPAGRFSFAMVEAEHGPHPWLLAFLLEQDGPAPGGAGGSWKMAGFYPHPRAAGGHDGLWYWTDARAKAAAKEPWTAWLEYGEADALLRPASFVSSTHMDALLGEQHTAAPPELANGVTSDTPVILKAADGTDFRITQLNTDASGRDGALRVVVHLEAQGSTDAAAMQARGTAAAQALVKAHPGLATAFTGVLVIVEGGSGNPQVVTLPMSSLH